MGRLSAKLFIVCLFVLGLATVVQAEIDVDEIRSLTVSGELLPLEQILQVVRSRVPGRAIEVELERKDDLLLYELEWLDTDGRVWEFKVDARSARILKQERD